MPAADYVDRPADRSPIEVFAARTVSRASSGAADCCLLIHRCFTTSATCDASLLCCCATSGATSISVTAPLVGFTSVSLLLHFNQDR
jgi:hypothetical protein